ncbi:hypothetical protein EPO04_03250 [Patescibacteria group bacterium]|nr:MAG: hypothetical protein EPO04_03250 [Patescibacteria group bacterium]
MQTIRRAVLAALLAYTMLIGIIGPLSQMSLTAGAKPAAFSIGKPAYAATAQEACSSYTGKDKSACESGYRGGDDGKTRSETCDRYANSNQSALACSAGFDAALMLHNGNPTTTSSNGESGSTDREEGCAKAQGPAAWFTCPMFDRITNFMVEGGQEIIRQFLVIEPLKFEGPMYDTWNTVRTLTNVLFVLIFLVVIFGNTVGMSAYHIRSMIPKLVVAVLLVQASFLITAVGVDIGNILGAGVVQLISGVMNHGATVSGPSGDALAGNLFLAAGLVVLVTIGWEIAGPLLLLVFLSAIAMIVTLAFRYFLIGVLIVVSPLAFAAMVLPGTEQYFDRWRSTFIRLILMYPIIMALLALAANVGALMPVSADSGAFGGDAAQALAPIVIKVLVLIACFSAVPMTFKWAGGFMELAASRIDDIRKGGHRAVRGSDAWKAGRHRQASRAANRADRAAAFANEGAGKNIFGRDNSASRFLQGALVGVAGASAGGGLDGALTRERRKQAAIGKIMDDFKSLNVSRGDKQKLVAARSKREVPASLQPYYSTLGQAAAFRSLNKDKARGEAASSEAALAAMAVTAEGKRRAEEIRKLAYQGEGGAMYGADPALANGGLGGKQALKPGSGSKIKSSDVAGIMSNVDSVRRNFGHSLSGGVEKATRQMGAVNAAGKVTGPDFVEQHLQAHGLVGGLATDLSVQAFKDSLKGRHFSETSGDARREMKDVLTNAEAGRRIMVLQNFEASLRAAGRTTEANEVQRRHTNLQNLRNEANTLITD